MALSANARPRGFQRCPAVFTTSTHSTNERGRQVEPPADELTFIQQWGLSFGWVELSSMQSSDRWREGDGVERLGQDEAGFWGWSRARHGQRLGCSVVGRRRSARIHSERRSGCYYRMNDPT